MSMADRDTKTQGTKAEGTRSGALTGFKELGGYIGEMEKAGDDKASRIILDPRKGILSDNLDGLKRMAVFWLVKGNEDKNRQNSGVEKKLRELDNYFSKNKSKLNNYQGTSSAQMGESQKKEVFKFSSGILRRVDSIIKEASQGGGASRDEIGLKTEWERFIKEVDAYYKDLLASVGANSILDKQVAPDDQNDYEEDNGEQLEARRKEIKQRELPEARFMAQKINMKHADILGETRKVIFSKLDYGRKGVADYSRYELVDILPGVLTQAAKPDFKSLLGKEFKKVKMKDKSQFYRHDKNENKRLVQNYKEAIFNLECGKKYEIQFENKVRNDIDIEIETLEGKINGLERKKGEQDENRTKQIQQEIDKLSNEIDRLYQEREKVQKKIDRLKNGGIESPEDKIEREKDWPAIKGEKVAPGAYDEYRQTKWLIIENARYNIEYFANNSKFRENEKLELLSNDYDENPIMLSNIYSELDALVSQVLLQHSTDMDDEDVKTNNEEFSGVKEAENDIEFSDSSEEEVQNHKDFLDYGIFEEDNYRNFWDYGGIFDVENDIDFGDYNNIPEVNNNRIFGGRGGYYAPNVKDLMLLYIGLSLSSSGPRSTDGMNGGFNMPELPAPFMYAMMNMGMIPGFYGRSKNLNKQAQRDSRGVLDRIGNMNDEWEIMRATALTCTSMVISLFNQLYQSSDSDLAVSDLFHKSYEILSDWITYNNMDIENWKDKGKNTRLNVLYEDLIDYIRDMHKDLKSHLRDSHNENYEERLVFRNIDKVNEMLLSKDKYFNSGNNFENNFMIEMYDMLRTIKVKKPEDIILGDIYKTDKNLVFNPTFFRADVPRNWWRIFLE